MPSLRKTSGDNGDLEAVELDDIWERKLVKADVAAWTGGQQPYWCQIAGIITLAFAFVALGPGLQLYALRLEVSLTPSNLLQGMRGNIDSLVKQELGGLSALFGGVTDSLVDKLVDTKKLQEPVVVMSTERSVIGSIHELWTAGHFFVASLILVFSIFVPLVKLALFALRACHVGPVVLGRIAGGLSKWSMADVFAVGIFIAMLAMNGVPTGQVLKFSANLGPGFYCFTLHTMLSSLSSFLLDALHTDGVKQCVH